jgi:hypothetical protein
VGGRRRRHLGCGRRRQGDHHEGKDAGHGKHKAILRPGRARRKGLGRAFQSGQKDVRARIGEILEIHGYHVLSASDPDDTAAVSQGHQGPIALIVADLLVPGGAGDRLVRRLGPRLPP